MKKEISLGKANRLINVGEVILVSSSYKDKSNIITLAWHMPLSHKPPLLGISLAKTHLSCELIEKQGEFVINVPDIRLLDQVIYCGTHSGRDVDKFKETQLTSLRAKRLLKTPLIKDCSAHLECYVRDIRPIGDHSLFIGEVICAQAEEDLFNEVWDVSKIKLIHHLGGRLFTLSGERIQV